ncbi:YcxB family protein [Ruminococcus sp. Marseille-P6503]|uniref:YcxB family protein n=1 Tax=Ruminococcus sp. Marseille-P6503 TaxID=2364796 RepID=UPI000F53BF62|nr:YcxB family protein [Ruminococcus sp. Marseille-P6503]
MDSENIVQDGSNGNEKENAEKIFEASPDISFEFNVTNEEEGEAFLTFQKKYVYRKNWIKTIGFALLAVGFAVSAWRDPSIAMNYILLGVCAAAIAAIWFNMKKIRSSLLEALKILEDDRYVFSLYDDSFVIETIITEEEKSSEDYQPIPPRTVRLDEEELDIIEKDDMFVVILKRDTIYVLPKRCMSEKQCEIFRNRLAAYFSENKRG